MKHNGKRFGTAFATLAAGVLFLSACTSAVGTGNAASGGETGTTDSADAARDDVRIAITSDAYNRFDPTTGWGHGSAPLIHSTLLEFDADKNLLNDLATDYEVTEDGLTYVFQLRDDAFFTDGEPVTAQDVAFTYNTALEKGAQNIPNLVTVEPAGDYEVVFTLDSPNSTLLNTVALVGIVPEHAYEENSTEPPIGSGPYKLVQWNEEEQVILEANPDYYGEQPGIERVAILVMTEDSAYAAAAAGEVDVALTSPSHALQPINGMRVEEVVTLDGRGVTLPMTLNTGETTENGYAIGNDFTGNSAVRQAMVYAIDRQAIAQDAINGYGIPAFTENDGMPWANPDATKIEQDVDKAKQLLADDGWVDSGDGILERDGVRAEFNVYYPADDSARQAIGLAAAGQLENVGIKMNVLGSNWDEITTLMFSNGVLMGWGDADPFMSYQLFHSSGKLQDDFLNPQGFDNPTVDKYLEAALAAQTPEEASEQFQLAQWDGTTGTSMLGEIPWLWLVSPDHLYFVRDGLSIGTQHLHGHGASWELLQNLPTWSWQ